MAQEKKAHSTERRRTINNHSECCSASIDWFVHIEIVRHGEENDFGP